ncbi:MAG: site-specific integrase [Pseudonocardia sp.]|nr:site-specific integrase [Pseudonocardia sp.]
MRAEVPVPAEPMAFVNALAPGWDRWPAESGTPVGTPFLISPSYEFDVELNAFFSSVEMTTSARNTQTGYAGDLAAFLTFLWCSRGRTGWRDATEDDHLAYLFWRRQDEQGPRVDPATWDREVAAVNSFYRWQVRAGHVAANPVPQRAPRLLPTHLGRRASGLGAIPETPATYSHGAAGERVEWLPPESYRRWRDTGMRGYTVDGLPDRRFRGRWAARNATFCDLMVRTGMRLAEQAALTVFEVPLQRGLGGHRRFWLPTAIAKGGSARWVYVPVSVISDLAAYVEFDRAEVVEQARGEGRYRRMPRPLVVEDPAVPIVTRRADGAAARIKVEHLAPHERRALLLDGPDGLEPASFWLSEFGTPVAVSSWKDLFREANERCRRRGLAVRAHAHLLRHTFAVMTLEQLQRGHIAALAGATAEQRGHYVRVFGDPLDWVRRRLGHRSVVTTQIYLHALAELEMDTRMALIPDVGEHPRSLPLSDLHAAHALSSDRPA